MHNKNSGGAASLSRVGSQKKTLSSLGRHKTSADPGSMFAQDLASLRQNDSQKPAKLKFPLIKNDTSLDDLLIDLLGPDQAKIVMNSDDDREQKDDDFEQKEEDVNKYSEMPIQNKKRIQIRSINITKTTKKKYRGPNSKANSEV